jgi:hypothetical protein
MYCVPDVFPSTMFESIVCNSYDKAGRLMSMAAGVGPRGVAPVLLALACLVVAASAQTDPGTLTDEAKEWLTGKKLKVKIYSKVR